MVKAVRNLAVAAVVLAATTVVMTNPTSAIISPTDGDDCPDVIAPVANLYEAFFLRPPDDAGLDYWVRFASSYEGNIGSVAAYFARSAEFNERYGELTNREFIAQLYRNVFDREADAEGLDYWTDALDRGEHTRGTVVLQWTLSFEYLGPDAIYSPLAYSTFDEEVWCGTGPANLRIERIDLGAAQSIGMQQLFPVSELDQTTDSGGFLNGFAENRTVVLSTTLIANSGGIYLHPTTNQAISYFELDVYTEQDWVVVSARFAPPWLVY